MLNILSHEGMQIKTTHSFSPSSDGYHEESRSQQQTKTSAGLGCGGRGTLTYCYWECKLAQSLCKWVLIFLQKLEIELPYDLAIAPPGRNPSQQTAKLLWASVPVPLLLEIAKEWGQCPSTEQEEETGVYSQSSNSDAEKNGVGSFAGKWMSWDYHISLQWVVRAFFPVNPKEKDKKRTGEQWW